MSMVEKRREALANQAVKLLLIRIPMVSFNVSVMFSKITLSYTSLGLLTSSRSPSLKLPSSMRWHFNVGVP